MLIVYIASPLAAQAPPPQSPFVAPPDVAAPPADAKRTASGLAFKVLKAGTGTERPKPADSVTVHYTGWTTEGRMFDSTMARRKPSTFPLSRVLPGWSEGVQMAELAYWLGWEAANAAEKPMWLEGEEFYDVTAKVRGSR